MDELEREKCMIDRVRKQAKLGQARPSVGLTWPMFIFERANHCVA